MSQRLEVVAHLLHAPDLEAELAQGTGKVGRIGVDDIPAQQLAADGKNGCPHTATSLASLLVASPGRRWYLPGDRLFRLPAQSTPSRYRFRCARSCPGPHTPP